MKILVVDDDEQARRAISRVLDLGGHTVLSAPDGGRGMDLFLGERPDIVVLDIFMPEQAGTEMLVKMRRLNPRARIIAISGGGQIGGIDVLSIARSLGADEIIGKPFRARDLLRLVGEIPPDIELDDGTVC